MTGYRPQPLPPHRRRRAWTVLAAVLAIVFAIGIATGVLLRGRRAV